MFTMRKGIMKKPRYPKEIVLSEFKQKGECRFHSFELRCKRYGHCTFPIGTIFGPGVYKVILRRVGEK